VHHQAHRRKLAGSVSQPAGTGKEPEPVGPTYVVTVKASPFGIFFNTGMNTIKTVTPNSDAADQGVKVGSTLVKINGVEVDADSRKGALDDAFRRQVFPIELTFVHATPMRPAVMMLCLLVYLIMMSLLVLMPWLTTNRWFYTPLRKVISQLNSSEFWRQRGVTFSLPTPGMGWCRCLSIMKHCVVIQYGLNGAAMV